MHLVLSSMTPFLSNFTISRSIMSISVGANTYCLTLLVMGGGCVINEVNGQPLLNDLHNKEIRRNLLSTRPIVLDITRCILYDGSFKFLNIKMQI